MTIWHLPYFLTGSRRFSMKRERRVQDPARDKYEEFRHEEAERERHERERESRREGSGDDPRRHASIMALRWAGSPPPTAKRYAHALRQWRALPGAVVQMVPEIPGGKEHVAEEEDEGRGFDRKDRQP
jgi:hypothetical protein